MSRISYCIAAIAALSTAGAASAAPFVAFENAAGGDYRIASIVNLQIGDDLYNVDFVHGGTYTDFADGVDDPITFSNFSSATTASIAIYQAINATNTDASTFSSLPGNLRVPYETVGSTHVRYIRSTRVIEDPITFTSTNGSITPVTTNATSSGSSTAEWAYFLLVPEPSSLALLIVGGLMVAHRRR